MNNSYLEYTWILMKTVEMNEKSRKLQKNKGVYLQI